MDKKMITTFRKDTKALGESRGENQADFRWMHVKAMSLNEIKCEAKKRDMTAPEFANYANFFKHLYN